MVSGVNGRASDNAPKAVAVERARKHENALVWKTEESTSLVAVAEHRSAMKKDAKVILSSPLYCDLYKNYFKDLFLSTIANISILNM